ncbi:MAG: response regulator, partial [Desulfobacterales bacterium]|nr:response regulator [Desulfobacterales bacterium]
TVTLIIDGEIRISVRDEAGGIPGDKLALIFEPFQQLETPYTKKHGGIGAGLAIVKTLCELMGGGIEVESEIAKGSTFTVRLPLHTPDDIEELPTVPITADKKKTGPRTTPSVLIVEDEGINRVYLKQLLMKKPYTILEAQDGEMAIYMTNRHHPDFILMDIGLPKLNGIEAIRRIRKDLQERPPIIVAVTAHAQLRDRRNILDAGADDIITKPYRAEDLFSVIAKFPDLN